MSDSASSLTNPRREGFHAGLDRLNRVAHHFAPGEGVAVTIGHAGRLTFNLEREAYAAERATELGLTEDPKYSGHGQRWWTGEWHGTALDVCVVLPDEEDS